MNRKNDVRRQSFSSEFRNAFVVRNKCEQLKLEKQHKSLDRLRAHESLDLTNKKREILSLQMSILSSKPDENTQDLSIKPETSQPLADINGTRKKFRSRALSTSASNINSFLGGGSGKDSRITPSSVNANIGKIYQFKKMSRSFSVSGNLDCFTRRKYTAALQTDKNNNEESLSVDNDESSSGQAIWKLLPPIQLTPLHKQKSKSLKEISSHLETPRRKMSNENTSCSWNDLQDCRYLRRTWKHDSCSESYGSKGKDASDSEVADFEDF